MDGHPNHFLTTLGGLIQALTGHFTVCKEWKRILNRKHDEAAFCEPHRVEKSTGTRVDQGGAEMDEAEGALQ